MSFTSRLTEGVFLCWDSATVQGAYVLAQRDNGDTKIVATSGPLPWPTKQKEVWRLEEEPEGQGQIWMRNEGRVLWHPPEEEDAVTFEERTPQKNWME